MRPFDLLGNGLGSPESWQGIGLALANGLKAGGARTVLNGRDTEKLSAAATQFETPVDHLAFDATDHPAARLTGDRYEADVGPIDILVNNAGMQYRTPLEQFPADVFERLPRTNVAETLP